MRKPKIGLGLCGLIMAVSLNLTNGYAEEELMAPAIQEGSIVQINYTLTVDGDVVDSSEGREPLSYTQGQGQIIPGLEKELVGLSIGDEKSVTVSPEEGYGVIDPQAFIEVPKDQLAPDVVPTIGQILRGNDNNGQPFQAAISKIDDKMVTLNLNHPLAGKTLTFQVKVVDITTGI